MNPIPPDLDNIPEYLKPFQNWILWAWGTTGKGKRTKLPVCPHRNESDKFFIASVNNPNTWGTFDQVADLCRRYEGKKLPGLTLDLGGIGFVNQGQVVALDFDNVVPPGGKISPPTWEMIRNAHTYTESSPSGTGIRMLFQIPADLEPLNIPKTRIDWANLNEAEAWTHKKYFTLTGMIPGEEYREIRRNDEFVRDFLKIISGTNGHVEPAPATSTAGGIIARRSAKPSRSVDEVRDILGRVSAEIPHDEWVRVGMAVHSWDPDEDGNRLWHEWSATAPDLYSREEAETKWRSFSVDGNPRGRVTLGTLKKMGESYPVDVFPDPVRRLMGEIRRVAGTPEELSGGIILGMISACLGRGLMIRNVRDGRDGLPTHHVLLFAESGAGKSLAFEELMKPWKKWTQAEEDEFRRITRPEINAKIGAYEQKIKRNNGEYAKKGNVEFILENTTLQAELESLHRKKRGTRFDCEDVTAEKLTRILADNGESGQEALFSVSDDAYQALGTLLGRYDEGNPNDNLYCKAWSGGSHTQDRQDGERGARTKAPLLTLLWLMQPDLLNLILENERLMRSGFVQRQLLDVIDYPLTERTETRTFDPEIVGKWDLLVQMLLAKFRKADQPAKIETEPGVRELMVKFTNECIRRMQSDLADVRDIVSRWAEIAWRMALSLHALRWGDEAGAQPVSLADARGGIRLSRYYADRKIRLLFARREEARDRLRESVVRLMKNMGGWITPSNLRQYRFASFHSTDKARTYLDQQTDLGYFTREVIEPEAGKGGKTSVRYRPVEREKTEIAKSAGGELHKDGGGSENSGGQV